MDEISLEEEVRLYGLLDQLRRVTRLRHVPRWLAERLAVSAEELGEILSGESLSSPEEVIRRAESALVELRTWAAQA